MFRTKSNLLGMALRVPTFLDSAEGFVQEFATTDDVAFAKITIVTGIGGVGIDGGAVRASNFADPTAAQDLATKVYVDSIASGLDLKASVRLATAAALPACTAAGSGVGKTLTANANGALSVDGVAVAVGNRILVKNQATGADNGIYAVTAAGGAGAPFVLTRSTDADQNAEVTAGMFTFVAEGTANADSGWVLVTDDTITVDTTALSFSQFSSTTSNTYDQGLVQSGSSIAVELDTGANGQGAGAGGGSSGLEFDVNSASGKLRAAVHATGGVERTATGLAAKLDTDSHPTAGATIVTSASGLKVAHAPKLAVRLVTSGAVAVADPVYISANNLVSKGQASALASSRIVAISLTADAGGGSVDLVEHGVAPGVLSGATFNTPYFLAASGGLTTTRPTGGNRIIRIGFALNATDLFVDIQDLGKSA